MMYHKLLYLDNCAFNRPYDDQSSIRIKLETDAKLFLQEKIRNKEVDLAWSYMLEFENSMNPYKNKRDQIQAWKDVATKTTYETKTILLTANTLQKKGLKKKDSLHIACAVEMGCKYFITTDDKILKKRQDIENIHVMNPIEFVSTLEE